MNNAKIIVLDDEAELADFVCVIAERLGFYAEAHTNAVRFKETYDNSANLIILDLMMPGVDGVEIIRYLSDIGCSASLILMSGFDSSVLHSAKKLAEEHGLNLVGSLSKPFRAVELLELLKGLDIKPKDVETLNRDSNIESAERLEQAILNNELVVYYQPKVELSFKGQPTVEALVRWQHPTRGLIFPDDFIPLAESHNLIDQLTWNVMNQVMSQCEQWKAEGLKVQVSVNMSAKTLKDLDIPEKIVALVKKYNIEESQIVLEITESALMQELITSLDILTRLRMKGFNLSIDDFGTGFSSLVQLYRAPFSEIKVDKSFVMDMENEPEAATIVETIILMGKKLNMKTIAEGVETEYCKNRLKELGCDQAQGYLFSKPIKSEDVLQWFADNADSSQ